MARAQPVTFGRLLNVGLAVAVGAALVGFAVGTRPSPGPEIEPRIPAAAAGLEGVAPSQPYAALRQRRFGPRAALTSDLRRLRRGFPAVGAPVKRTAAAHGRALAQRARRRAYAGAPPSIPHPIDQQSAAACLACHRDGIVLEGRRAPVISHRLLTSCTQCHVPAAGPPGGPPAAAAENAFAGRGSPGAGARAHAGAPPAIPHDTAMRGACASCHGVTGPAGLRTTHPERQSCTQCHAATTSLPPSARRGAVRRTRGGRRR